MGYGDNWGGKCTLLTETVEKNAMNAPQVVLKPARAVWCRATSVKQNEFYQAAQQGYKAEIQIEIRKKSYSADITHLKFRNKTYRILRTYQPKLPDSIGFVCVDKAGTVECYE